MLLVTTVFRIHQLYPLQMAPIPFKRDVLSIKLNCIQCWGSSSGTQPFCCHYSQFHHYRHHHQCIPTAQIPLTLSLLLLIISIGRSSRLHSVSIKCFNQVSAISSLNGKPSKLVDHFIYLNSNIKQFNLAWVHSLNVKNSSISNNSV